MPNWCYNFLYLKEDNPTILKAFEDISVDHSIGQQIPGIGMESYLFDVTVDDGQINFQTRWGTDEDDIKRIALYFKTNFELEYEEGGNEVYGRMIHQDGVFTNYALDDTDLDQVIFQLDEDGDPDWDQYFTLDGEEYDSYSEVIEELIDRKIKKATDAHTDSTTKENGETVSSNP